MQLKATRIALVAAALCVSSGAWAESYIVMANSNKLPRGLDTEIQQAGGTITARLPQIGIVLVDTDDAEFQEAASGIRGVSSVMHDVRVKWQQPIRRQALGSGNFANPPASGDDDFYFDLQWGHDAVDAVEAWNKGFRGAGVRVAVLDSGIDADHPDLAPNLNTALSVSFVPGEGFDVVDTPAPDDTDTFSHGSHTAGTIGAADNAYGTIGIAPEAELVAVKVLSQFTGSGSFGGIIQGIVYAALIDADVINMSLGAAIPHNCTFPVLDENGDPTGETEHFPASECAALLTATQRAATFAVQNGTTVIASAGNEAVDANHDGSLVHLPSQLANVISISATGPNGWALDPGTNLDVPAFYTNYGQSHIDLAAPGGTVDFDLLASGLICGGVPCYVYDFVFSTAGDGGWYWSIGTSMAAPHASGVAALIIGAHGGDMHPAQVEAALKQSADDLGKPGKDAFYGSGRVNANSGL